MLCITFPALSSPSIIPPFIDTIWLFPLTPPVWCRVLDDRRAFQTAETGSHIVAARPVVTALRAAGDRKVPLPKAGAQGGEEGCELQVASGLPPAGRSSTEERPELWAPAVKDLLHRVLGLYPQTCPRSKGSENKSVKWQTGSSFDYLTEGGIRRWKFGKSGMNVIIFPDGWCENLTFPNNSLPITPPWEWRKKTTQKFLLSKSSFRMWQAINVITSGDFQAREGRSDQDSLSFPRENSKCNGKSEHALEVRSEACAQPFCKLTALRQST